MDFLRDELADGPVEWQQVERDRKAAGITEMTLRRVRESLGVKIRREGEPGKRGGGRSVWELPGVLPAQKDLLVQHVHIEKNEQVNNSSFKNGPLPKTSEHLNPDSRSRLMGMAEAQGWPRLGIGQGITVKAGEEAWQKFAAKATQGMLEMALEALGAME